MLNRDGSESNGYLDSNDMVEDLMISSGCHEADQLAKELFGFQFYILHRIEINLKLLYLRMRRHNHNLIHKRLKL